MSHFWWWARLAAVIAPLALTAYGGIVQGIDSAASATTPAERLATASQLLYGVCAVAALIAVLARRRWVFPLLIVWGIALTLTGAMAPVVWGGTGALVGLLGGASVAAFVGVVLWAWRQSRLGELREAGLERASEPSKMAPS